MGLCLQQWKWQIYSRGADHHSHYYMHSCLLLALYYLQNKETVQLTPSPYYPVATSENATMSATTTPAYTSVMTPPQEKASGTTEPEYNVETSYTASGRVFVPEPVIQVTAVALSPPPSVNPDYKSSSEYGT